MKIDIDMVLLEKALRFGNMTAMEINEVFGLTQGRVARFRKKFGIERPMLFRCNVCGEMKTANVFKVSYPGICIKCRVKMGIEDSHWKGGRPKMETVQTARTKCLKCQKPFLTRLGFNGQKINRICPICTKVNGYLGAEEIELRIAL